MRRLPPFNALRAFDAAARHLNFRLAAEELGVTQGAVAQQIRGLEAEEVGPICPDFGELWNGMISVPEEEDFILTFTDIYEGVVE